jgi:hypothetical protein
MNNEKLHNWLNSEINKDAKELQREKNKLINEILKHTKVDIVQPPKKISIWKKILKMLGILKN